MRRVLEICVDSPEGLTEAVAGGADRIELCSALDLGGLTPSAGLMHDAALCGRPVVAMIRPRAGGFVWTEADVQMMEADIAAARDAGLRGVVVGAATEAGHLDLPVLHRLVRAAGPMEVILHRVVDLLPDRLEAVDQAVQLGIARILSSGGAARAIDGVAELAAMRDRAAGRLEVMPGAGITAETLPALLAALDPAEVHASARSVAPDAAPALRRLGFAVSCARRTDREQVAALRSVLDGWTDPRTTKSP